MTTLKKKMQNPRKLSIQQSVVNLPIWDGKEYNTVYGNEMKLELVRPMKMQKNSKYILKNYTKIKTFSENFIIKDIHNPFTLLDKKKEKQNDTDTLLLPEKNNINITTDFIISEYLKFDLWEEETEKSLGEEKFLDVWNQLVQYKNQKINPSTFPTPCSLAQQGWSLWWSIIQLQLNHPTLSKQATNILRSKKRKKIDK
jgi:hypothetical protein